MICIQVLVFWALLIGALVFIAWALGDGGLAKEPEWPDAADEDIDRP